VQLPRVRGLLVGPLGQPLELLGGLGFVLHVGPQPQQGCHRIEQPADTRGPGRMHAAFDHPLDQTQGRPGDALGQQIQRQFRVA